MGEYPEMGGYEQKQFYHHYEIDFGRRLVAKFRFHPATFWREDHYPQVTRDALYPNENDALYRMARQVKSELGSTS